MSCVTGDGGGTYVGSRKSSLTSDAPVHSAAQVY